MSDGVDDDRIMVKALVSKTLKTRRTAALKIKLKIPQDTISILEYKNFGILKKFARSKKM